MGLNLEVVGQNNKFDIIIVGSGIAGLLCANFLVDKKIPICLLDANAPGGMIKTAQNITSFPNCNQTSGKDLIDYLFSQLISKNKAKYFYGKVNLIKKQKNDKYYLYTNNGITWEAKAVILACGYINQKINYLSNFNLDNITYYHFYENCLNKSVLVFITNNNDLQRLANSSIFNASNIYCILNNDLSFYDQTIISQLTAKKVSFFHYSKFQTIESQNNQNILLIDNQKIIFDYIIIANQCFCDLSFLPVELVKNSQSSLIEVNDNQQTNISGLYAIGHCCVPINISFSDMINQAKKISLDITNYIQKFND